MIATAVVPIASPIRTRRKKAFGIACRTGDEGCSRSTTKRQAEIMNRPSSAASIRYSGQCRFQAGFMVSRPLDAGTSPRFRPVIECRQKGDPVRRKTRKALKLSAEHATAALQMLIEEGKIAVADVARALKRREALI